jgi:hypothetical protein
MAILLDLLNYKDQQFGSFEVIYSREIRGEHVCYFAGHSPFQEYPEYVIYFLEKIVEAGFEIIFISSSQIGSLTLATLQSSCSAIIEKANKGADFGAWKVALGVTGHGREFRTILLANDSILGPFSDLEPIIRKFTLSGSDYFGLTKSFQRGEHIQSYFVLINNRVLLNEVWTDFWNNLLLYRDKIEIVENYEIYFTKMLRSAGFKCGIWSDWQGLTDEGSIRKKILKNANLFQNWGAAFFAFGDNFILDINPCAFYWKELITLLDFPFLKRELVLQKKLNVEYDVLKNWKDPVSATGYPINLISQILSLGEINTVIRSFPFNDDKLQFRYYHAAGEAHFTNFILLFREKSFVERGSHCYLTIHDPLSDRTLMFRFIYLSEEDIDGIIEDRESRTRLLPETTQNEYNLLLPYSDEPVPYLQSLSQTQTAIFRTYEEYESGMLRFIQHVIPDSRSWEDLSRSIGNSVIDLSDLRSFAVLPDQPQVTAGGRPVEDSLSFFELLNRYHREYEALPMWYKKIGQVFKIAMGHKIVKFELKNNRPKMVLKHKKTVNERDRINFIKNWYYHEYDVLPGWYKKFGKLINKRK